MTFGIAFVHPLYTGIVTDRLLSGASTKDSDKCGLVVYSNGRFAYTFSGLAEALPFLTRKQLALALCEAASPEDPSSPGLGVREALVLVAETLTREFKKLNVVDPAVNKRTSILFAGFRLAENGAPVHELYLVSNFERLDGSPPTTARPTFSVEGIENGGVGLSWIGSPNLSQSERDSIFEILCKDEFLANDVVRELVKCIRTASARQSESVGPRCSSIIVPSSFDARSQVRYHSDSPVSSIEGGAFVLAAYGNDGAYINIDQRVLDAKYDGRTAIAAVQPVHKRQRCPCGSGKQYKNCHGHPRFRAEVDTYELRGTSRMIAMPADGSGLVMMSNEVLK